jgi:hypothetical protein
MVFLDMSLDRVKTDGDEAIRAKKTRWEARFSKWRSGRHTHPHPENASKKYNHP